MVNLALKVAIASGFGLALVFRGDGVEQRAAVVSEALAPTEAVAPASPPADSQLPATKAAAALLPEIPETLQSVAAGVFAAEVRRLSAAADDVDLLWQDYKAKCGVQVSRQYDFGREWFALWDRAAEPTVDAPGCADALGRIRQAGEKVRRETLRARATPHLTRGTEIGLVRWNGLQWPQAEEARSAQARPGVQSASVSARPAEDRPSTNRPSREP